MDYRAALIEFYQKHNPDKLREIDLLLAKYRGREEELLHALKVKYGVHKTTIPTQQQPITSPQTPPKSRQQETQPLSKEPDKKAEPTVQEEESKQPEESQESEHQSGHQVYSSGGNRGRNAAERAEYWRNELEKRERERSGASKPVNKLTSKVKEVEYETEDEVETEEEENTNGSSWFSVKKIVIILILVALLGGVAFALLNDNLRSSLFGPTKTEEPKQEKKSGIDPNVIAQNQDSAVSKSSGDFALEEESEEEDASMEKENQTSSGKKSPVAEEEYVPDKKRVDDSPPKEDRVPGELQANNWYLSYITVSEESAAKKAVREVKAQGYDNSGYYYIPDYDPRGKRLYKVYIGPYSTVEAAERALDDNLRKISPGTYPYLLK